MEDWLIIYGLPLAVLALLYFFVWAFFTDHTSDKPSIRDMRGEHSHSDRDEPPRESEAEKADRLYQEEKREKNWGWIFGLDKDDDDD